jgi:hypothetical protein
MNKSALGNEIDQLRGVADGTHAPAGGENLASGADFQLDMLMNEEDEALLYRSEVERSRGRPKGRVNRSTEQMRSFIANNGFKDPLLFLASTYSRDIEELAKELGVSRGEAFSFMQRAAFYALPYLHQKTPTAIELPPDTPRGLIVIEGGEFTAHRTARDDGVMSIHESEPSP